MTLDEAIIHAREVAENVRYNAYTFTESDLLKEECRKAKAECLECAKEHEQLADWLEELKDYREGKRTCENCKHQNKAEDQYPCSICRCNHPNMFEWEKENKND